MLYEAVGGGSVNFPKQALGVSCQFSLDDHSFPLPAKKLGELTQPVQWVEE